MLHNDERFAEVLAKVSSMQADIIIFSETKSSHDIVELDDGVQSHACLGIGKKHVQQGSYSDACSTQEMGKAKSCCV